MLPSRLPVCGTSVLTVSCLFFFNRVTSSTLRSMSLTRLIGWPRFSLFHCIPGVPYLRKLLPPRTLRCLCIQNVYGHALDMCYTDRTLPLPVRITGIWACVRHVHRHMHRCDGIGWYDMAWYGMAFHSMARMARDGVVWRGVAWRGVAWRGVAWARMVWLGMVWVGRWTK